MTSSGKSIQQKLFDQRTRFKKTNEIPLLLTDDSFCEDFHNEAEIIYNDDDILGEGNYGKVYKVRIPSLGSDFALKKIDPEPTSLEMIHLNTNKEYHSYREIAEIIEKMFYIPRSVIFILNGVSDPSTKVKVVRINGTSLIPLVLPVAKIECGKVKDVIIHPITEEKISLPRDNTWICDNYDPLGDFYFGQLASNFYLNGQSINFIPMLGYSSCVDESPDKLVDSASNTDMKKIYNDVAKVYKQFLNIQIKNSEKGVLDQDAQNEVIRRVLQFKEFHQSFDQLSNKLKAAIIKDYFDTIGLTNQRHINFSNDVIKLAEEIVNIVDAKSYYILLELIDGDVSNNINFIASLSPRRIHCIYFQLLHALALLQEKHGIVHGDLHLGNIFIEKVKPTTMFNGQKLEKADFYHYSVDNVDYYFPATSMIIKIGDFGMAKQFKKDRVVMDYRAYEESMNGGHERAQFTSWPTKSYDVLYAFFMLFFNIVVEVSTFDDIEMSFEYNEEIIDAFKKQDDVTKNLYKRIFGFKGEYISEIVDNLDEERYDLLSLRPKNNFTVDKDKEGLSALSLIKSGVFKEYTQKPSWGKIATLGTF